MRIGVIAPPWLPVPPPAYGGTESFLDRLARGFVAAGHEVLLWTTGDSTCAVDRAHHFAHARTEELGDETIESVHVAEGYAAMAAWGADVVQDNTLLGPAYAAGMTSFPVITTCHGPLDGHHGDRYRQVTGQVHIVAISADQASRAEGIQIDAVIHHGVDLDRVPVGTGAGDEKGHYFVHIGRMSPDKGVVEAITAVRGARGRLVIASKVREPAEQEFFRQRVAPLLGDDVTFVGEVSARERDQLVGAASALVNPIQWNEPFGLVMIEALACGTPVVALDRGSVREIVDHGVTGYVCRDHDDLVDALGSVGRLDRRAARAAAAARFSTERMVAGYLDLFAATLDRRGAMTVFG